MADDWEDEDSWGEEYEDYALTTDFGDCPECGEEMDVDAEQCPGCGYWLTTRERHKLWDGNSRSRAALSVGQIVLVIVLSALFLGSMFGMIR